MKTALIIYWSKTGNTQKVAEAIKQGLEETGIQVTMKKPEEAESLDYFDYDLVCVGCPSYSWHPPEPMTAFLKKKLRSLSPTRQNKTVCSQSARKKCFNICHMVWSSYRP
jgi:menaquinone-dependent protoporphyrinogen IX oxidase